MDRRAFTVLVLAAATVATAGLVSAVGAGAVLLGNQVVEAGRDANPPGSAEAFRTTASVTGTVSKLTVYVDAGSTATTLVAGLYADASGHPGALLGQGTLAAPTANAWNDVPLPGVAVTAGTTYWIAILGPSGTLRFRDRCCGGGSPAEVHAGSGLSALPAAWATGATYRDGPLSAYGSSVDSSPVLVVTPATLSFTGAVGGPAPATRTIAIANGGAGTLPWSATTSAPWLGISPAGGAGPGSATVSASTNGLAAGTYSGSVTVTAAGAQGSPQTVSVSLSVTAPDSLPPSAPSNLAATVNGSAVGLVWGASTDEVGVTRYEVHRSASTGFAPSAATLIGETATATTAYTDPGRSAGTWHYRVVAFDAAGNASDPSNQATGSVAEPPPGPAFMLGDQGIGAQTDFSPGGVAEAFRTTAAAAGTLSQLTVYVDATSTATTFSAGIYADSGGHPAALLGQGSLSAPVAGAWNRINVPPVAITAGTTYWIALLAPASTGTLRFRDRGTGGAAEGSAQTNLTSLPSTWSTGASYTDGPLSAWGGGSGQSGPPPDQIGDWSAPSAWPITAVHMSLLPTGNVLAFDAWTDAPNTQRIWYPASGSFTGVPNGSNLFCSGHVLLPDGRTMIVGGHVAADVGIRDTSLFDAGTNTWSKAADMSVTRWYPTATVLGDGKVFVFGGDAILDRGLPYSPTYFKEASQNSLPSVYNPLTNQWNDLTGARLTTPLYPYLFQLPDGRILNAGPDPTTRVMTPGTWAWSTIATSPFDGGSAVTYLPGKVMKSGAYGNTDYFGANTLASHARTAVIDATQASPAWRETAAMNYPRSYHNQTLLPDGTVLASGGTSTSDGVDVSAAVLPAEIWNPQTEVWTTVDSLATARGYHSTALLLPDGRVLMAGGGQLPGRATNNLTGEIYSPAYLFKGQRPAITTAPSLVEYATTFDIVTPDAASIQTVALIRTPSVTHAFDENQRYVPLSFTRNGGRLSVQAPANGNLAPPGYYMLFILNGDGVPSIAPFVRFPAPSEDTQAPGVTTGLTATPGAPGTVATSWTAATDNVAVTVYNVYRSTTSGFVPSLTNRIARPSGTSYLDTGLAAGTYYYVVRAEDAAGNLGGASNQATATVAGTGDTTPPTVSISAPAAGATVSATVTVSATATDAVGVTGVQFRLDGQVLGAEDTSSPYSTSWTTTTATNGAHTLTAVARDAAGNSTTSAPVGVTVQNAAPPPTTFLLGYQAVAAYQDSNAAGVAEAFQTTASVTGTVRRLTIYTDGASTATSVVAGLYTDAAGRPGTLLAQGSITSPAAGAWSNVTVAATAVTAGTRYWIAVLGPTGAGVFRFRDRRMGGLAETSQQTTLASLPATWTTGRRYTDGPISGYGAGSVP